MTTGTANGIITRKDELATASRWPVFGAEEKAAVCATLDSDNLYGVTAAFEKAFADYHGMRYALATNNGTSAIHSAYFAVGVGPGDEVITSSYTWHLQVSQILALHALPVFCDIEPLSGCMDPEDLRRKITPRTKAIAVVHTYGALAPMDEIMALARARGIPVIEDCSHAHGATYHGRKAGTLGDIGCFSLQAAKLVTAIEGGILITNKEEYFERACALAHYDRIPALKSAKLHRYHPDDPSVPPTCLGFKYRMHPLAAALAQSQFAHLDEWNAVRRRNMMHLTKRIGEIGGDVFAPPFEAPGTQRTWLAYICQFHAGHARRGTRDALIEALRARGLPATGGRAGYLPIYWNPLYLDRDDMWGPGYPFDAPYVKQKVEYRRGLCPQAEAFGQRTVGLPMLHPEVSTELLEEIVAAVSAALRETGCM